ncbi:MAG TPA: RNA 2',3'-cyclic phosphodiesterase [Candidatus Saccharimonadales bacterium]|nr:RNA 2',3'-cyclic phosphodiesterase [Candidatus Saccharimonadales bacterium]
MRLFIALAIDEAIQQRLDDYVRTLQPRLPGVRFVASSNYHVTLKFLGEVQSPEPVRQRLRTVRASAFEVTFASVGFFPNEHAPRVFWAGIGAPALPGLARSIDQSLEGLGFPQEREFHPHLTLARNGSGRPRPRRGERSPEAFAQLGKIVSSSPAPEFGTMAAREFFLYESKLSSLGPSYYKLERFELAG